MKVYWRSIPKIGKNPPPGFFMENLFQRLNTVDAREQVDVFHAVGGLEWYVINECINADITTYIQNNEKLQNDKFTNYNNPLLKFVIHL